MWKGIIMYDIKFDRKNHNSIIIKKDGKMVRMIAIPPSNKLGCDIIDFNGELHRGYNYDFDGLIIINKRLGKLMFWKGELLDHIIYKKKV